MKLALKELLQRRKMSQTELASRIDVSRGFVSELVNGKKSPSPATIQAISEALGISPGELFSFEFSEPNRKGPSGLDENDVFFHQPDGNNSTEMQVTAIRDLPAFSILTGDILTFSPQKIAPTDCLVIATLADTDTGNSHSIIARLARNILIKGDHSQPSIMIDDESQTTAILGIIKHIHRKF